MKPAHVRVRGISMAMVGLVMAVSAPAQITTRADVVGKLLNEWYGKGQAAGLAKITYENRDGGHSSLDTAQYPQLQVFKADAKSGSGTGPAEMLRGAPTVGNCSMAAPATNGGSLPRLYQMSGKGSMFLMAQYLSNQVFVYPEHQDYDIGANGIGGYGDLYPLNQATTIISQGSSGSDQPFLHAVLTTLAALSPETQDLLMQKRILMPTLQAILRQSSRRVAKEEDYYTGAAHPPVFDAAQLDEGKMVQVAHEMTPAKIPPLVHLQVTEETPWQADRDFFELPDVTPHKLADTPVSIGRILRGVGAEYEMQVSAARSGDHLRRPLQIRWQLLQGSADAVEITPSASGKEARVRVRWQPPITTETGIRSHRVDIGVFATNGISASAPAFISFYCLPNEMRFHDRGGRVTEIHYQAHNPDLGLPRSAGDPRWLRLMQALLAAGDGLQSRLLQPLLSAGERAAMAAAWRPLHRREQALPGLGKKAADEERAEIGTAVSAALAAKLPGDRGLPLRETLTAVLNVLANRADLYPAFHAELDALAAASPKEAATTGLRAELQRVMDLGILTKQASGAVALVTPVGELSEGERYAMRGVNLLLLSEVLFPEALERSTAPAWVDPRLTTPKPWRDVYRYDTQSGALLGWVRHGGGRRAYFDAQGRHLPQGFERPEAAQPVRYEKNAAGLLEWRVK